MPQLQRRLRAGRASAAALAASQRANAVEASSAAADHSSSPRLLAAPTTIPLSSLLDRYFSIQPHTHRHSPTPPPSRPVSNSPTALAIFITHAHCQNCGATATRAGDYALLVYSPNEHATRFSRASLTSSELDLPRERRERTIEVPFCAECF